MKARLLIITIILFVPRLLAAAIIDDPTLLYLNSAADNTILEEKVTINWKITDFNDFVNRLNKVYRIDSEIINYSNTKQFGPIALIIDNKPLSNAIDYVSTKFGYDWVYKDNIIIFSALNKQTQISSPHFLKPQKLWSLEPKDGTLRNVLVKWCKDAKWQLIWNVKADYPITSTWHIKGSFEKAINEVLKSSQNHEIPLMANMHDNNRVLEIYSPSK